MKLPAVFKSTFRNDIVQFVHTNMNKNRRQAHGVFFKAGQQHSAESWGTGRAVARIPRISGSGTHRSGQGVFGNQCRKGRMFAPLKTWRRWHRKVNLTHKRHALATAVAATAATPLIFSRGHKIPHVPEVPYVCDSLDIETTKQLRGDLFKLALSHDIIKCRKSKKIRTGKGKARNSRYVMKKGPLLVYGDANLKVKQAARNLPGVETCHVSRLNLLQLAPGGQIGRFVLYTKDAFEQLDKIFGTKRVPGIQKKGYRLNRAPMTCQDLARVINSDLIQSKLRPVKKNVVVHNKTKKNPLKNKTIMKRLNPYEEKRKALIKAEDEKRFKNKKATLKQKRKDKKSKQGRNKTYKDLQDGLVNSFKIAEDRLQDQENLDRMDSGDEDE